MTLDPRKGGALTIDLAAVIHNWSLLSSRCADGTKVAAVVKADGYGLGAGAVARALFTAGCRWFCVALPDEAMRLHDVLTPLSGSHPPVIQVLNGLFPGAEMEYAARGLVPTLNHLDEVARWREAAGTLDRALPAALQIDTGMTRLGLTKNEQAILADDPGLLTGIDLRLIMSHLACADDPDDPMTDRQSASFAAALSSFAAGGIRGPASLANTAGTLRSTSLHHDLVRPGCGIYGIEPLPGTRAGFRKVARLQARILQVQRVDTPQTVGYGADHKIDRPGTVATVSVGYADGYLRALSGRGHAWIGSYRVSIIGRVSMDLIALDVSAVPDAMTRPGQVVDLLGPGWDNDIDGLDAASALGREAGTIGYEILTGLGSRYSRHYINEPG